MHRTVLRAFPDADDGGPGRVLFRIEPLPTEQEPVVLVQSHLEPDWAALESHGDYLQRLQYKSVQFEIQRGQYLRFRLRANPTVTRDGKRHGLFQTDEQLNWLCRKGERQGFEPQDVVVRRAQRQRSTRGNPPRIHWAVDYEGTLAITEPDAFYDALANGIGPAKGYGFGLLSIAPA
jgi:CRISPR system Cascade subunit CasE